MLAKQAVRAAAAGASNDAICAADKETRSRCVQHDQRRCPAEREIRRTRIPFLAPGAMLPLSVMQLPLILLRREQVPASTVRRRQQARSETVPAHRRHRTPYGRLPSCRQQRSHRRTGCCSCRPSIAIDRPVARCLAAEQARHETPEYRDTTKRRGWNTLPDKKRQQGLDFTPWIQTAGKTAELFNDEKTVDSREKLPSPVTEVIQPKRHHHQHRDKSTGEQPPHPVHARCDAHLIADGRKCNSCRAGRK